MNTIASVSAWDESFYTRESMSNDTTEEEIRDWTGIGACSIVARLAITKMESFAALTMSVIPIPLRIGTSLAHPTTLDTCKVQQL